MSPEPFTLDWQGIALSVTYRANSYGPNVHHLEIRVLEPAGAILPVTDTGYRSHFFHDDVDAHGGVAAYVTAWLDQAATDPAWKRRQEAARQLRLF
jgi:hypothetical protein